MTGIAQCTPSYRTNEHWDITSAVCCTWPWKAIYSSDLSEEKSRGQLHLQQGQMQQSSRAAERFYANIGLPQLEASVGRWQLAPQKHWPVHRSEAGWCDNSRLSPLVPEPSSQVWLAPSSPEKNVGCGCWLSDLHADEETFHLRARDSGVTYVHTHAHVGAVSM